LKFDANFWKDGKWWIIDAPALEVTTQGRTKKDALLMLKDAILALLNDRSYKLEVVEEGKGKAAIVVKNPVKLLSLALERKRATSDKTVGALAQDEVSKWDLPGGKRQTRN
jgi:predicted RNase H-like HicB family nuclease